MTSKINNLRYVLGEDTLDMLIREGIDLSILLPYTIIYVQERLFLLLRCLRESHEVQC